jgi:MarR family transcriptional regulator for hemolysin
VTACATIEAALSEMRGTLFEGIGDDDIAACLRVFATLQERLGRNAPATQEGRK